MVGRTINARNLPLHLIDKGSDIVSCRRRGALGVRDFETRLVSWKTGGKEEPRARTAGKQQELRAVFHSRRRDLEVVGSWGLFVFTCYLTCEITPFHSTRLLPLHNKN